MISLNNKPRNRVDVDLFKPQKTYGDGGTIKFFCELSWKLNHKRYKRNKRTSLKNFPFVAFVSFVVQSTMPKNLFLTLTALILLSGASLQAQTTYNLSQVVQIAKSQSPYALRAETQKENRYWQWRNFRSNYKPQLSLRGSFPDFNRSVIPIRQPEGDYIFRQVFNSLSGVSLQLSQTVGATGGEIFVASSMNMFHDFKTGFTQYTSRPVLIGFEQPVFAFNPLKWDKKIEPLRFEESKRAYSVDLEKISQEATELFFDLLLAQIGQDIATNNYSNNDTLYKIAQAKFDRGLTSRNELIQIRLNVMNAQKDLAQAEVDLETATLNLTSFIGLDENGTLVLDLPETIPQFEVDVDKALMHAYANKEEVIAFQRRRIEARRDLAQAKSNSGLQVNISGSLGFVTETSEVSELYGTAQNQQTINVSFSIPILDWGRNKSRMQTAAANQKLVEYTVAQDERRFEQSIMTQVRQFRTLRQQLEITQLSADMSQERYDIAQERFILGDISITDLNIAMQEKDQARRNYISSLRAFWVAYYNLRILTLYDFELQQDLYDTSETSRKGLQN